MLEGLGLKARLEHRPADLSVGERQRVAICRSLINDPELILADEPTGNLDPAMTGEVIDILRDVHTRGFTIVIATHDRDLVKDGGSRLVTLHSGAIGHRSRA